MVALIVALIATVTDGQEEDQYYAIFVGRVASIVGCPDAAS
jgi:hypothetical protein